MKDLIYFDSAATLLPKPAEVKRAALRAMDLGNPGRGGHRSAMDAARTLYRARETLAAHFGVSSPERVCFFYNATTALNCVIKSLASPDAELLISDMEHNAVRRPALASRFGKVTVFNAFDAPERVLSSFSAALTPKTRLAVFIYASNICPTVLPVKELVKEAKKRGVLTVIDCAQAGGHIPLSISDLCADGLVFPSHKGLMGIAGAGILVASSALQSALEKAPTVMEGGSGVLSFETGMPAQLPERLEWGTAALPAIASAAAGVRYIEQFSYGEIAFRERKLFDRTLEGLSVLPGLSIPGLPPSGAHIGPILFSCRKADNAAIARALFEHGFCLREGFHCAPSAHRTIGTAETGGVRVSFSPFNNTAEVDRFLLCLRRLL